MEERTSHVAPGNAKPAWQEGALYAAVIMGLLLRLAAYHATGPWKPGGQEAGYLRSVATLASGYGRLMHTRPVAEAHRSPEGAYIDILMKRREAAGGRIDREHPFPETTEGWLPATLHPAGYSYLLYALYVIGNHSGMVTAGRLLQFAADAFACLLIFLFARNVFGRRVGILAAWSYALLPPAILLTCYLLPDAFTRFFIALILCLASYTDANRGWMMIVTGAAIGLACHFRPDFLLLPGVLFLVLWAWRGRFWNTLVWTGGMVASVLLVLSPWILWTRAATGRAMVGTTSAGATMYQALGQVPGNPWGITCLDSWIDQDAINRGFVSSWSVDADPFYRRAWLQAIAAHPTYYAKLVLLHRLPYALVPPYATKRSKEERRQFSFDKLRLEEGLSPWGVVYRYPLTVLRTYWSSLLLMALSGLLLLSFVCAVVAYRRQWRALAWLVLPWAYTVGSMSVIKQFAPRQVSPILVVQVIALALALLALQRHIGSSNDGIRVDGFFQGGVIGGLTAWMPERLGSWVGN